MKKILLAISICILLISPCYADTNNNVSQEEMLQIVRDSIKVKYTNVTIDSVTINVVCEPMIELVSGNCFIEFQLIDSYMLPEDQAYNLAVEKYSLKAHTGTYTVERLSDRIRIFCNDGSGNVTNNRTPASDIMNNITNNTPNNTTNNVVNNNAEKIGPGNYSGMNNSLDSLPLPGRQHSYAYAIGQRNNPTAKSSVYEKQNNIYDGDIGYIETIYTVTAPNIGNQTFNVVVKISSRGDYLKNVEEQKNIFEESGYNVISYERYNAQKANEFPSSYYSYSSNTLVENSK